MRCDLLRKCQYAKVCASQKWSETWIDSLCVFFTCYIMGTIQEVQEEDHSCRNEYGPGAWQGASFSTCWCTIREWVWLGFNFCLCWNCFHLNQDEEEEEEEEEECNVNRKLYIEAVTIVKCLRLYQVRELWRTCDYTGANVVVSQRLNSLRGVMVCKCGFSETSFFVVCDDMWIAK